MEDSIHLLKLVCIALSIADNRCPLCNSWGRGTGTVGICADNDHL